MPIRTPGASTIRAYGPSFSFSMARVCDRTVIGVHIRVAADPILDRRPPKARAQRRARAFDHANDKAAQLVGAASPGGHTGPRKADKAAQEGGRLYLGTLCLKADAHRQLLVRVDQQEQLTGAQRLRRRDAQHESKPWSHSIYRYCAGALARAAHRADETPHARGGSLSALSAL